MNRAERRLVKRVIAALSGDEGRACRIVVTEIDKKTHAHLRYIMLNFPRAHEKGGYTQAVSFNAFFHGGGSHNPRVLYYEQDFAMWKSHIANMADVPRVYCNSMWAFYHLIGYQHKTKRWV